MDIRQKLILSFLLITIVSISLISFLSFEYVQHYVHEIDKLKMEIELNQIISTVQLSHNKASEELIYALKNPDFVRYFELQDTRDGNTYDENGVLQFTEKQRQLKNQLDEFIFYFQNKFKLDEICLIDKTGQEHVRFVLDQTALDNELSSNEKLAPFFEPSLQLNQNEVYVQEPYLSPDTQNLVFAYTSPVVLDDGEKPAFLHFEMTIDIFTDLIHPEIGQVLVVDKSGSILFDSGMHSVYAAETLQPNELNVDTHKHIFSTQGNVTTGFEGPKFSNLLDDVTSTSSGFNTFSDETTSYNVIHKELPSFGWKLIYFMPYYPLLTNPIFDDFAYDLFLTSVIILGIGIFSAIFVSNKLTIPLLRLKDIVNKISKREYGDEFDIPVNSKDELGLLEKSFREMFNKIVRTEQERDEFISVITHELKAPLTPIQGYAYMLNEKQLGNLNERQKNAIVQILENTNNLLQLIENLLAVQKLDLNKMVFHLERIRLDKFTKSIHSTLSSLMIEKNIHFENLINKNITVVADPAKLKEVFINMIQNAVDFVDQNGKISFGIFDELSSHVVLYVKDNGWGISKENQKNIFKKFWQVDSSLRRKHGGTGLGLAICRDYITQMGGEIWVVSEVGKGATFYFTLLLAKEKSN